MTRLPTRAPLAVVLLAALPALAQTTLTPPAERISDLAIGRDHQAYESLQSRIKALGDAGRAQRDGPLSKAQCWLDVSFHEYTRNDRSAFPQAALAESEKLIAAMEARSGPLPLPQDTPLVAGAEKLRPDLWAAATALRSHAGWSCAQAAAACAEVELVHAGHEHRQQGWRHAQPYVQIAEDLVERAQAQAAACLPKVPAVAAVPAAAPVAAVAAPPAPVPPVAAAVQPARVAPRPQTLSAELVFDFDGTDAHHVKGDGLRRLDALLDRVRDEGLQVSAVTLGGHADRLKGAGRPDYNQQLSERRVATIRERLLLRGVAPALISGTGYGDKLPVESCAGYPARSAELRECLLPNRRVELRITAVPR